MHRNQAVFADLMLRKATKCLRKSKPGTAHRCLTEIVPRSYLKEFRKWNEKSARLATLSA
jgi:hypothetical protein